MPYFKAADSIKDGHRRTLAQQVKIAYSRCPRITSISNAQLCKMIAVEDYP